MATYDFGLVGAAGHIAGRAAALAAGAEPARPILLLRQDWRQARMTDASLTVRVMVKPDESSPAVPFENARVWVQRAGDGFHAWEGHTSAGGYMVAQGLEQGVAYRALAVDLAGTYDAQVSAAVPSGSPDVVTLQFGVAGGGSSYTPSAFCYDGATWVPIGVAQWNGTAWQ